MVVYKSGGAHPFLSFSLLPSPLFSSTLTPPSRLEVVFRRPRIQNGEGGVNFGGREPNEKRSSLPIESSLALVVSLLAPPKTALHLDQNLRSQFTVVSRDSLRHWTWTWAWHHSGVYGEYTAIPLCRVIPTMWCRWTLQENSWRSTAGVKVYNQTDGVF